MGLTIVKKLVESQGGRVGVAGNGATRGTIIRFDWKKAIENMGVQ